MMTTLVATSSERVKRFMETCIKQERRDAVVERAADRDRLLKRIKELKPNLVLIEANFQRTATAYFVTQIAVKNKSLRIGVITFNDLSEREKGEFYAAGAIALVDFRADEEVFLRFLKPLILGRENYSDAIQGALENAPVLDIRHTGITPREMEMIRLSCEGITNEEIGNLMGIEGGTVKNIKTKLYEKCKVTNMVELFCLAVEMGWVEITRGKNNDSAD
jgi:DNA-binding NarL/FixJ family response regulator